MLILDPFFKQYICASDHFSRNLPVHSSEGCRGIKPSTSMLNLVTIYAHVFVVRSGNLIRRIVISITLDTLLWQLVQIELNAIQLTNIHDEGFTHPSYGRWSALISRSTVIDFIQSDLPRRTLKSDPKLEYNNRWSTTKRLMPQVMACLLHGKTSSVIAYRLSTMVNADIILVVHAGQIFEDCNHSELLAYGGIYWNYIIQDS